MKSTKKHIECFEDYRCKVIEQFKSAAPDDYVVTMRCAHWPQFRLLVKRLFEPAAPVHDVLSEYNVEWVDSAIPCYFHTDPIRNTVIGNQLSVISSSKVEIKSLEPRENNSSDKQIVQSVNLKFTGWDGLICVSKGNDKLYLCNVRHYSNGRPIGFLFAAYKNRNFVEDLIADYWKAENSQLVVKDPYCRNKMTNRITF